MDRIEYIELFQSGALLESPQSVIIFCKKNPSVKYCLFKNISRFTRSGARYYEELKEKLTDLEVKMFDAEGVITNEEVNTLDNLGVKYEWSTYDRSLESERAEAEKAESGRREILTKLIGAEIRYIRKGYWAGPPPPGFSIGYVETDDDGKRAVLVPHPTEAPLFVRMFELRAQGNISDQEIVDQVNLMGYKSRTKKRREKGGIAVIGLIGGVPLTVKQLHCFVQNPLYAAVIVHSWTEYKPIKAKFDGLVTPELWNKANRGDKTIVFEGEKVHIVRKNINEWLLRKNKINPNFPYKQYVLCPICRQNLYGSAPRNKNGRHIARYHCQRGHKFWSINKVKFDETIEKFVRAIKFSDKYKAGLRKMALEELEKRQDSLLGDSLTYQQQVYNLTAKKKGILQKMRILTNEEALKDSEKELEEVTGQLALLNKDRNTTEGAEVEVSALIDRFVYYLEHLGELILEGDDKLQNAEFFGFLFDEKPTYQDLVLGTPKLAYLFALNEELFKPQIVSAPPAGLEPTTTSLEPTCSIQLSYGGDASIIPINPLDTPMVPVYDRWHAP